jgi:hypothetical protein
MTMCCGRHANCLLKSVCLLLQNSILEDQLERAVSRVNRVTTGRRTSYRGQGWGRHVDDFI